MIEENVGFVKRPRLYANSYKFNTNYHELVRTNNELRLEEGEKRKDQLSGLSLVYECNCFVNLNFGVKY